MAYHSWLGHFGCFSNDMGGIDVLDARRGEELIRAFWEVLRLMDLMVVRA